MSRQTITRTQYTLGVVYGFLGGWASLELYRAWRTGWRPWQWEALIVPLICLAAAIPEMLWILWRRRRQRPDGPQ